MYDQSFSKRALARVLYQGDFWGVPAATRVAYTKDLLDNASTSAHSDLQAAVANPLTSFLLKKKPVFQMAHLHHDIVLRKISRNLRRHRKGVLKGRGAIIACLRLLLEEGVPYRVYRLDIRSFYESFSKAQIKTVISGMEGLSPLTKKLTLTVLRNHTLLGGRGLPRGLALSGILSDMLMNTFDTTISSKKGVHFYSRYVDDIIIMTSGEEKESEFIRNIKKALPEELALNPNKQKIVSLEKRVSSVVSTTIPNRLAEIEYLGYQFTVDEPLRHSGKPPGSYLRDVLVEIADSKIKKIKTRIARSFLAFKIDNDWPLLLDRIKYLTNNFSILHKTGSRKLAGIYYSYPMLTSESDSLRELDYFLKNAVLSKSGGGTRIGGVLLSSTQRRALLAQSFRTGHSSKSFVHFSAPRIAMIQKCWRY